MTYQQTTDTNTGRTLLKGCGIAALVMFVLVGLLAYGGWRLSRKVESAAADSTWTVNIGDKLERSFGKGLATQHFTITGSSDGSKGTSSSVSSYFNGKKSVKSECLSPVIKAVPKQPAAWTTPTATQRQAIVAQLESLSKGLGQKYAGSMKVDTKEHLVSVLNVRTGVLCVAKFGQGLS